eukprot:617910-Lingulodinium_polyedra.AAC.1
MPSAHRSTSAARSTSRTSSGWQTRPPAPAMNGRPATSTRARWLRRTGPPRSTLTCFTWASRLRMSCVATATGAG